MALVYVLQLQHGCYYVGVTLNPIADLVEAHLSGYGVEWTKIHQPLAILKQIECGNSLNSRIYTDMYVKQYMLEFGIDKVRGGSFSNCKLDKMQRRALNKELWYAKKCCSRCGRTTHCGTSCYARKDVNGDTISDDVKVGAIDTIGKDSGQDADERLASLVCEYNAAVNTLLNSSNVNKEVKDCIRATRSVIHAISTGRVQRRGVENTVTVESKERTDARRAENAATGISTGISTSVSSGISIGMDAARKVTCIDMLKRMTGKKTAFVNQKHTPSKGERPPIDTVTTVEIPVQVKEEKKRTSRAERVEAPFDTDVKSCLNVPVLITPTSNRRDAAAQIRLGVNKKEACTRCGRTSHIRPQCRETTDIHGFDLTDFLF